MICYIYTHTYIQQYNLQSFGNSDQFAWPPTLVFHPPRNHTLEPNGLEEPNEETNSQAPSGCFTHLWKKKIIESRIYTHINIYMYIYTYYIYIVYMYIRIRCIAVCHYVLNNFWTLPNPVGFQRSGAIFLGFLGVSLILSHTHFLVWYPTVSCDSPKMICFPISWIASQNTHFKVAKLKMLSCSMLFAVRPHNMMGTAFLGRMMHLKLSQQTQRGSLPR